MNYLADNKHDIKFHLLAYQFNLVSLELYKFFFHGRKNIWHLQILGIHFLSHEHVFLYSDLMKYFKYMTDNVV